MSKDIFKSEELEQVKTAIERAEKKTNAEIVLAIYPICGEYDTVLIEVFMTTALSVAFSLWIYESFLTWVPLPSWQVSFLPFVIGVLCVISVWPMPIRRLLVDKTARRENTLEAAKMHFFENELFDTRNRNAVLVFVAIWERQIVILGDKGVNAHVATSYWDESVVQLAKGMHEKRFADELCLFVSTIGDLLGSYFPSTTDNQNELSDSVHGPLQ